MKTTFPMGEDYGLVRKEELGDGKVLRVESDDWGWMVCVIDEDLNLLYGYELAIDKEHLEEVIAEAKLMVK